jgi:hypothetical protein
LGLAGAPKIKRCQVEFLRTRVPPVISCTSCTAQSSCQRFDRNGVADGKGSLSPKPPQSTQRDSCILKPISLNDNGRKVDFDLPATGVRIECPSHTARKGKVEGGTGGSDRISI